MTDSDRLDARLNQAARRRPAKMKDPARIGPDVARAVAELARKHVTDPDNFRPATDEQLAAKDAADALQAARDKADSMLSRLPARYRRADYLPDESGRKAAQWVDEYRQGHRQSLVIMGPVGTGKTWLAAAIARHLMTDARRPVPTMLVAVADMLAMLRGARPGLDVDMVMWSAAPVLVLDDLGLENQTEWTREQLYRLSHARYHNDLPTIVTTNLRGPEIHEAYESRTVQRLFGGARLIELTGESRRDLPF